MCFDSPLVFRITIVMDIGLVWDQDLLLGLVLLLIGSSFDLL